MHYRESVELVDIFPTVLDLLDLPMLRDGEKEQCSARDTGMGKPCSLDGISLAPVILPLKFEISKQSSASIGVHFPEIHAPKALPVAASTARHGQNSPSSKNSIWNTAWRVVVDAAMWFTQSGVATTQDSTFGKYIDMTLPKVYAISQKWVCAPISRVQYQFRQMGGYRSRYEKGQQWSNCLVHRGAEEEEHVSLMGYSLRTATFRYTMWVPYEQSSCTISRDESKIFAEEFYIHNKSNPALSHSGEAELRNMIYGSPEIVKNVSDIRRIFYNILFHPKYFKYNCWT